MKKILLFIFISLSAFIFYQIILGENGLVEGYRVRKEKERLVYYTSLLTREKAELGHYIDYLKTDPDALRSIAEKLGFFNDEKNFIKVIENARDSTNDLLFPDDMESARKVNRIINEFESTNPLTERINSIRSTIMICFVSIFALFLIIIILGGKKNDNED
jgi:hypothetical protein